MIERSDTANPQSNIQNLKLPKQPVPRDKNGMKAKGHVMSDVHRPGRELKAAPACPWIFTKIFLINERHF